LIRTVIAACGLAPFGRQRCEAASGEGTASSPRRQCAFDTLSTGPVTLWVTGWKKTLIERWAQVLPMVALMWAGNPIKSLLPVQISATIFSTVRFREDLGSMLAA
jgi:hypothetical protein